jgi:GxxExxY protein
MNDAETNFEHEPFLHNNNEIILEVKAQVGIHEECVPQVVNYLAITKIPIGLILNFGEGSLRHKRLAFTRKKSA